MLRKKLQKLLDTHASKWLVLVIDIGLALVSFIGAYFIRFNATFDFDTSRLKVQLPIVLVVSIISFLVAGSYKGIIRHTGIRDAFNVFVATTLIVVSLVVLVALNAILSLPKFFTIPISIIIIYFFVVTFLLIMSRFVYKSFFEILNTHHDSNKNVLIYGAGDSGIITYSALQRETKSSYYIVKGFIDDDKSKVGKQIDRVKIYDIEHINERFVEKNNISDIIISIQNISSSQLLGITELLIKLPVKVKIVPPVSKWITGNLKANQIKEVAIDDLLNRDPINLSNPNVERDVYNKVILITGAAGSIGSEIVRQVSQYKHKHLILIDQAESAIYDVQQELIQNNVRNFTALVSDVCDSKRINEIFNLYSPDVIYHAAAYKHVPLMEETPYEAVKVNVFGTKCIADLAVEYGVERFVMVSTDKAVNPTNVMGATKRVAEMYVGCLSENYRNTKFTITRFGNVLGSNGSVIPLFKKQIAKGGPLTVTHENITRYFMTIPEACKLVLEAGTMGEGGEIYIFDMGKSVKIFDIAKRMIYLSGLKYPEDISIKVTGLRPGEKLYEELLADGENTVSTYHEKIMIAKAKKINCSQVRKEILLLEEIYNHADATTIVSALKNIVPEYISNNSTFEKLDKLENQQKIY